MDSLAVLTELLQLVDALASSEAPSRKSLEQLSETLLMNGIEPLPPSSHGSFLSTSRDALQRRIHLEEWWAATTSEKTKWSITGYAEVMAAALEAGEAIPPDVIEALGEDKLKDQELFLEFIDSHVPEFNIENGHVLLAKKLDVMSVYHAWKSGDPGVREFVWEKLGRRWEWMKARGNFLLAGRELTGIGHEDVGKILMNYSHLSPEGVAFQLACHGGEEMGGEVRQEVGIEPFAGGFIEPILEARVGISPSIYATGVQVLDDGRTVLVCGVEWGWRKVDLFSGESTPLPDLQVSIFAVDGAVCHASGLLWTQAPIDDDSTEPVGLRIMDTGTGKTVQTLPAFVHPDTGEALRDRLVGVWAVGQDTVLVQLSGFLFKLERDVAGKWGVSGRPVLQDWPPPALRVHVTKDGRLIVINTRKGCLDVFDWKSTSESSVKPCCSLNDTQPVSPHVLASLPDGRIVSGSGSGRLAVWDADLKGGVRRTTLRHADEITAICVLTTGAIVSGDAAGAMKAWDADSLEPIGSWIGHDGSVEQVRPLGEGARFVSIGEGQGDAGHVSIWDLSRLNAPGQRNQQGHRSQVRVGCVLDDGRLVSGGMGGEIVVWKPAVRGSGSVVDHVIDISTEAARHISHCQGGFVVARLSNGLEVIVGGKKVGELPGVTGEVWFMRPLNGGKLLVGLDDQAVSLWDVGALKIVTQVKVRGCRARLLNDKQMVVAGFAGSLAIVNFRAGVVERSGFVELGDASGLVRDGPSRVLGVTETDILWQVKLEDIKDGGKIPHVVVKENVGWLYGSIADHGILIESRVGDVELHDPKSRDAKIRLGGLDGDRVEWVHWDDEREQVVFFMREGSYLLYKFDQFKD